MSNTILIIGILAILVACGGLYCYMTNKPVENRNNLEKGSGDTINEGSVITNSEPIFTEETYPRIDGSTATIPLSEAFKAEFLGKKIDEISVKHNTTHYAYENLISGDTDLILVTYPSEEELQMAEKEGIELEIVPVVNEAFVFFNNDKNPIESLTLEQIQKIYTGEIANWSEVGGENVPIKAYQREANSGSQTGMLKFVMKGLKLIDPPKEDIIEDMIWIIGLVSNYENNLDAIGYSYYYYATTMYDTIDAEVANRIRLLAVNGVEPNNETIKNGTYPIRTNYYMVYDKAEPEDSPVRRLAEAMLSARGQKAAEAVGYVGL